jgi:hypothetical protein
MPIDRSKYPANWKEISHEIRFVRANGCCEWCGVKHGAWGARDLEGKWWDEIDIIEIASDGEAKRLFGCEHPKMIRIIITTAHLGTPYPDGSPCPKTNTMDCRPENLAALCQRCHLNYDKDQRKDSAYITRMRKRVLAGNRLISEPFKRIIFGG